MLEVLNELVPADLVVLQIANMQKPEAFSAITLPEDHATPGRIGLIGQYSHQSPFVAYYLATWDSHWKMITDFMPLEDFYRRICTGWPWGPSASTIRSLACWAFWMEPAMPLPSAGPIKGLRNANGSRLNVIQPHLVTSFINAAVCSRAQQSISQIRAAMETAPGAYGYFDPEGRVSWISGESRSLVAGVFCG